MSTHKEPPLEHLNALLRGEISAVESYRSALEKAEGPARATLEGCCRTHEQHVAQLSDLITRHGGTPAARSGVWGSVVKLFEGSAAMLGMKALVTALEEGEELGRHDYTAMLAKLDLESREVIESAMLHDQKRNLEALATLKKTLSLVGYRRATSFTSEVAQPGIGALRWGAAVGIYQLCWPRSASQRGGMGAGGTGAEVGVGAGIVGVGDGEGVVGVGDGVGAGRGVGAGVGVGEGVGAGVGLGIGGDVGTCAGEAGPSSIAAPCP
jgi:hypothetical protein